MSSGLTKRPVEQPIVYLGNKRLVKTEIEMNDKLVLKFKDKYRITAKVIELKDNSMVRAKIIVNPTPDSETDEQLEEGKEIEFGKEYVFECNKRDS